MNRHVTLAVSALLFGACGEPADDAASAPSAPAEAPAPEAAAPAAANPAALSLTCAAPFTPDATAATLAAAYGAENVVPETIDGPEGTKLNVTAIYPTDPAKRVEVYFKDEEARTGLAWATVKSASSVWSGPGGIRIGEGIDRVQTINGGVFQIAGWGWDYGGIVMDWSGGKLNETAPGCMTSVRFERDAANSDRSIEGDTPHPSDSGAIRAANPKVSEFGIRW